MRNSTTVAPSPARAAARPSAPLPALRPLAPMLGPESPLTDLKGVGPAKAALLAKLGLHTILDALYYLPERHEDRSQLTPLRNLKPGMVTTAIGVVKEIRPAWNRFAPLSVILTDSTGGLLAAIWFRQSHLARVFQRGQRLIVHGNNRARTKGFAYCSRPCSDAARAANISKAKRRRRTRVA